MSTIRIDTDKLPLELGDGLRLRRACAQDAAALSDFNAMVHSEEGPEKPDDRLWAWTNDLMSGSHPTFSPDDCTIVEEISTGKIVSSMNLIPQVWTYSGIPFQLGRPELVGTLIEYRKRGLVRRQFEVIHSWSAQRGDKVQAITGIPYYYRQFGYEMALNLGGGRVGYPTHIPRLKEGEPEPYLIRPATVADIPFISQIYEMACTRYLITCRWDETLWKYEITGKSEKNVNREELRVIETPTGRPCGFFIHPPFTWGDVMVLQAYEILPEYSWLEVTPSVMRYLEHIYTQYKPAQGEKKPFGAFGFWLGEDHPVYHVIPDRLPRERKPYAFYLRVPDVPGYLHLITPTLEKRLADSPFAGYTGEVKLTFYRDGVRLGFEHGRLTVIESKKPMPYGHAGDAGFPPNTFLQLLFGFRSLEMLKASFPDCWTDRDEIHALLDALFPRQISDIWPIS